MPTDESGQREADEWEAGRPGKLFHCGACDQEHIRGESCTKKVVGERGPRRCLLRYGSCALNNGHKGRHNAYVGPWAGSFDGLELDDE